MDVLYHAVKKQNMGIKMAIPWYQIEEEALQAGVHVYSSNYTLYAEMSRRFFRF